MHLGISIDFKFPHATFRVRASMVILKNPYADSNIDFEALALQDDRFAPHVVKSAKGRATINWGDQQAVKNLTLALLRRDFELELTLPDDRLCPTVPGRLEYVIWILQLAIDGSHEDNGHGANRPLTGLDIGTGASAIYPLLACRTLDHTRFIATDIDSHSIEFARSNVIRNHLQDRVKIVQTDVQGPFIPDEISNGIETIDLTICNPPFYESHDEIASSLAAKKLEPFAVCTGSNNEMVTPGGEVAFVGRLVDESLQRGNRISVAKYLPPSNTHTYHCSSTSTSLSASLEPWKMLEQVQQIVTSTLNALDQVEIKWTRFDVDRRIAMIKTVRNTWNRKARRGNVLGSSATDGRGTSDVEMRHQQSDAVNLEARLTLTVETSLNVDGVGESDHVKLTAEWTKGYDRHTKDWTTLWSFLIRKVANATKR
ncbi:hypothetical protein OIO90_004383 [Microbotryomycetes sp. JL221]|nr:hypothetical protein OIO90_004383 [Microbotryomycetes sp. JL221]